MTNFEKIVLYSFLNLLFAIIVKFGIYVNELFILGGLNLVLQFIGGLLVWLGVSMLVKRIREAWAIK